MRRDRAAPRRRLDETLQAAGLRGRDQRRAPRRLDAAGRAARDAGTPSPRRGLRTTATASRPRRATARRTSPAASASTSSASSRTAGASRPTAAPPSGSSCGATSACSVLQTSSHGPTRWKLTEVADLRGDRLLVLHGELDIATAPELVEMLHRFRRQGHAVVRRSRRGHVHGLDRADDADGRPPRRRRATAGRSRSGARRPPCGASSTSRVSGACWTSSVQRDDGEPHRAADRADRPHRRARDVRRAALARRGRPELGRVLQPPVRGHLPAGGHGPRRDLPLRRRAPPRARRGQLRHPARHVRRRPGDGRDRAGRARVAARGPRDRDLERDGRGRPGRVQEPDPRVHAGLHADGRRRPLAGRDPLRPRPGPPAAERLRALPALHARQDRRAGRLRPPGDQQAGPGAPAAGADGPRARGARVGDPAPVRHPARLLQPGGAQPRRPRADRRRAAGRAAGPAPRAPAPARPRRAGDRDDAAGGGRAPAPRAPRPAPHAAPGLRGAS